jgi:hypothetical protein
VQFFAKLLSGPFLKVMFDSAAFQKQVLRHQLHKKKTQVSRDQWTNGSLKKFKNIEKKKFKNTINQIFIEINIWKIYIKIYWKYIWNYIWKNIWKYIWNYIWKFIWKYVWKFIWKYVWKYISKYIQKYMNFNLPACSVLGAINSLQN